MQSSRKTILPGVPDPMTILPGVPAHKSAQPVQLNVCNKANNLLSNIGNLNLSNCVDGSCSKHVKSVNKHLTRLQNCANKHSGISNNTQPWVSSFDNLQSSYVDVNNHSTKKHNHSHSHGHSHKMHFKGNSSGGATSGGATSGNLKSSARPRAF